MKRVCWMLLVLVLCFGTALAEETDNPFFHIRQWNAEEIDISGVQEIDGRLVGVVKLPETTLYGLPTAQLLVDCPLPMDFTEEQKAVLHVSHRDVAVSDGDEANIDSGYFHAQLSDQSLSADPAFEKEYAQAKEAVRELVESSGGKVAESVFHANRRDAAHSDWYSRTESSDAAEMSAKRRAHFDEAEAKNGRNQRDITMVRGLYELYGLPVMYQFYYLKDGDWIGVSSEFRAAVRDDGTICFVEISGLPQVMGKEPLDLPDFDWRTLLGQAVAHLCATNAQPEDCVSDAEDGRVIYAGYSVITDLKPCWVGMTQDTLVPGWYCVTEQRVQKDDSLAATWALYADAQTLMTRLNEGGDMEK